MKVPFLDLQAQYLTIRPEVRGAIDEVCETQRFILGMQVQSLEGEIARYCRTSYAVGLSSGTDALLAALMAMGIGPGDEVITTPYSFIATAGSIIRTGARPVFVDIEPQSFNLNPDLIADRITERTKAILPVHLFGRCAEMAPLLDLATRHHLAVIEDAAQAIGAETADGRRAGGIGTVGCFSFYPSKNLGGFGDGGMTTTNDADLAALLKSLRKHGADVPYEHHVVGGNFRLDELQAAVLRVKLKHLDMWTACRQRHARRYDVAFRELGLEGSHILTLPEIPKNGRHVFNQYVIKTERRDEIAQHLRDRGVGAAIYYPKPLHLQTCFAVLGYKEGDFPESEQAARTSLALPIYPELTEQMQELVIEAILEFFQPR